MATKTVSDITVGLNIQPLPNTGLAKVAVLTDTKNTLSNDGKTHYYSYNTIDALTGDFDATSSLYNLLEAGFNTPNFNGVFEVIAAPGSASAPANNAAQTTPTNNGANISTNNGANSSNSSSSSNPFVDALKQVINDGFNYVVDDGLSVADKEAVADYLYENQAAAFITQVSGTADLATLHSYSTSNQPRTDSKLNGLYVIVETTTGTSQERFPAIQTAAYLAQFNEDTGALDAMKVGDLPEFTPDSDLGYEDYQTIRDNRGSAIVDKADMEMQLTGYATGGDTHDPKSSNYLDNFVNTKVVKDRFQYNLQRALNSLQTREYTQDTIDFLYTIAVNTGTSLVEEGFLASTPTITKPVLAQISSVDIEARHLGGFNVIANIGQSVESMKIQINLSE